MRDELDGIARQWTDLGTLDPTWAALTTRRRGGWDEAAFLDSGRAEIDGLLTLLTRRGLDPPRGTALDFGCGPGRLSAGLAGAGFHHVIGLDIAPTMIDAARRVVKDTRCDFRLNLSPDLRGIPCATVDFVYSARVLQHMPWALAAGYVREFLRVATAGGVVAFQLPAAPRGPAAHAIQLLPTRLRDGLRGGMQMHGTAPAEVVRLIADAGGVTVSVEDDDLAGSRWHSHLYLARPCQDGAPERPPTDLTGRAPA